MALRGMDGALLTTGDFGCSNDGATSTADSNYDALKCCYKGTAAAKRTIAEQNRKSAGNAKACTTANAGTFGGANTA